MRKAALYVHGKGGSALEAESFRKNLPGCTICGADFAIGFPWTAEEPIRAAYGALRQEHDSIILIANSIGAYFSMHALQRCAISKALFISPVLDMERLILDMMSRAGVTEDQLREQGEIPTDSGETLSWAYLSFVRAHPISWTVPTEILIAGQDPLVPRDAAGDFAARHSGRLCVMENGEHWFHTPEQLAFLDAWMKKAAW